MTTPTRTVAEVLRGHCDYSGGGSPSSCFCGWEGDDYADHLAASLLASFVVLPKPAEEKSTNGL